MKSSSLVRDAIISLDISLLNIHHLFMVTTNGSITSSKIPTKKDEIINTHSITPASFTNLMDKDFLNIFIYSVLISFNLILPFEQLCIMLTSSLRRNYRVR